MKRLLLMTAMLVATVACATPGVWSGEITASTCVGEHVSAIHGKTEPARQCAEDCIKGGAKYVFLSDGKVYQIANQSNPALKTYLGQSVELIGDVTGDTIISVSKIEAQGPDAAR